MASLDTLPEEIIDQIVSNLDHNIDIPNFVRWNEASHIRLVGGWPDYTKYALGHGEYYGAHPSYESEKDQNRAALVSLSLVSKIFHRIAEPHLYKRIRVSCTDIDRSGVSVSGSRILRTLINRPELAQGIKTLSTCIEATICPRRWQTEWTAISTSSITTYNLPYPSDVFHLLHYKRNAIGDNRGIIETSGFAFYNNPLSAILARLVGLERLHLTRMHYFSNGLDEDMWRALLAQVAVHCPLLRVLTIKHVRSFSILKDVLKLRRLEFLCLNNVQLSQKEAEDVGRTQVKSNVRILSWTWLDGSSKGLRSFATIFPRLETFLLHIPVFHHQGSDIFRVVDDALHVIGAPYFRILAIYIEAREGENIQFLIGDPKHGDFHRCMEPNKQKSFFIAADSEGRGSMIMALRDFPQTEYDHRQSHWLWGGLRLVAQAISYFSFPASVYVESEKEFEYCCREKIRDVCDKWDIELDLEPPSSRTV